MAPIEAADAIIPALESFILEIQQGTAYIATEDLIGASSRTHRAKQLAQVFNQVTESGSAT
jgi:hypothetical protein